jgi:hypothetical protein
VHAKEFRDPTRFAASFVPLIFFRALGQHGREQYPEERCGSDKTSPTVHEEFQEAARNFDERLAGVWMELRKHPRGPSLDPFVDSDVLKACSERYPLVSHREDIRGFQLVKRSRKLRL